MFKNFIFIISFILFICGCNEKKTSDTEESIESISLNPHEAVESINLSEIADSVKCIRLQTESNDIMGRVNEIIIRQKYIYAKDVSQQMIFVFDKEGKFVAKLNKKGQGPDEYNWLGPFVIGDNEEYIEVVNSAGSKSTLLKYTNLSFNLVDKNPFPNVNSNAFRRNNGFYYFATQQMDNTINGKETNAGLIIVNDKNEYKVLFDKKINTEHFIFSPNEESFTINDKNELFLTLMYDNTFYRLEGEDVYPVYSVDFGKYSINNKIGLESTRKQFNYIQGAIGRASFPVLNLNNDDIMSFSYYFKQSEGEMYSEEDYRLYIKMKKTGKVYHTKKIKNDITDFPDNLIISSFFFGCTHEVWYENYLVDIIRPDKYFPDDTSKVFVEGLGEITAYDNPIVVMMKLKEN